MLSTAAWNAFLKTLEEPPPNTVFVLATTDAQKVPPTVVDRCHRFDFQRPGAEQIATVLERVARTESIAIGPEAVALLARHAAGSFRDALGTLEQLQTYAGSEIALADVLAVLGISDAELLFRALDAVAGADPRGALLAVVEAVDGGRDPAAFIRELEAHAREVLIVQVQGGVVPAELRLTPERDERLLEQASALPAAALVRTLDLLATALTHLRAGADARTQLELALIRAARPELDPTVESLAARVERLEHGHGGGGVAREAEVAERNEGAAAAASEAEPSPSRDSPEQATQRPRPPAEALTLESLARTWSTVVDHVRATNPMLGAVIGDARPVELAGDHLVLAFGEDAEFLRRRAEERASRATLGEALASVTGHKLSLSYELRAGAAPERPQTLSEDELLARLLDEFDAEVLANSDEEGS
jgi:DNA polymerase-3 subunit gamma/tau